MKRIIFKNLDGSVSIIIPAPNARLTQKVKIGDEDILDGDGNILKTIKVDDNGESIVDEKGFFVLCALTRPVYEVQFTETEDDFVQRIAEKDVPEGLEYRITDVSNIPSDRTFRNAWTDDNPTETVDVDMPKARIIHMDRLREIRDEKLVELDKRKYGSEKDAERQALRDMPTNTDLSIVTTPEELKAIMPNELKETK